MLKNFDLLIDAIGMVGVVVVLLVYFLSQIEKLSSNSVLYSTANLLGSLLIILSLAFHWNLASFCVEFAWIFISIIGLRKALQKKKIIDAGFQDAS